jgi:hypothetical protein
VSCDFDFSGFGLRLSGDDPVLDQLAAHWADFAGAAPRIALEVRVERAEGRIPAGNRMEAGTQETPLPAGRRLARIEGAIELPGARVAVLGLREGDPSRRMWGAINLLAQALGRALPAEGGLLLHAAGALVDGRAFLLPGSSGAGKTTWARACAAAGLPVLSDDHVLVDLGAEVPFALGSPLRGRDFPSPGRGRWPLAGVLLARHGTPGLGPAPRLRLSAILQANALFASPHDARVGDLLNRLVERVPTRELSFSPDPSFVPLLRSFAP